MHTLALIAALALAGAPGASVRGGTGERLAPTFRLTSGTAAAVAGRTLSSSVEHASGTVLRLEWTQVVPGTDGFFGADTFTLQVLVGPEAGPLVAVCTLAVDCDAPAKDYITECRDASYEASGTAMTDIDVRVTSMPCTDAPAGFQTTLVQQR